MEPIKIRLCNVYVLDHGAESGISSVTNFLSSRSTFSSLYVFGEFQYFTYDQAFFLFERDQKGTLEKSGDTEAFLFSFLVVLPAFELPKTERLKITELWASKFVGKPI